jgi:hypothetical protein
MRFRIPWVSATSFGLAGYLLAAGIVVLYVGWHPVFLPALLASAAAVYGMSTWLGTLAKRRPRGFLAAISVGVAIALSTLVAGAVASGAVNVSLAWLDEATSTSLGLGYISIWNSIRAYLINPTVAALVFGGWIAVILGVGYGVLLYVKGRAGRPHVV